MTPGPLLNATGNTHFLLTPGPLTTSLATKRAMLRDWGSRDDGFVALTADIRERLVRIPAGEGTHVCVPMQGCGTFAVEAVMGTLIPRDAKTLLLVNGAYGRRIARILEVMGRAYEILETPEHVPSDVQALEAKLRTDPGITDVVVVHCETTSGIANPIAEIAEVVHSRGRRLHIDAMSSFGSLPLDARQQPFDAVVASSNKCLEGAPGMAFAVVRRTRLESCKGNAHSLSLDLYDQWRAFEGNGQWRFTPPTHVLAAFAEALCEFEAEGGVDGRGARYRRNAEILITGMREMGFETLLPDHLQAPIIVTFMMPMDDRFDFKSFYDGLRGHGFVVYPGKLTTVDSFRIGCIGQIGETEMRAVLAAIRSTLKRLGVTDCRPRPAFLP